MSSTPLADAILAAVPTGAKLENEFGNGFMVLPDTAQIKRTYQFWKYIFEGLGEALFKDRNTATIKFARAVPNELMSKLPAFKERNRLLDTGTTDQKLRKQELQFLIKSAGCMVSLSEISEFLGSNSDVLFDDLKALEKASTEEDPSKIDMDALNRGVRACRELSDLIRKVSFCKEIEKEFGISYVEMLALYRQEGALALTPFKESYSFGTLIATKKETCRSPDMVIQLFNPIKRVFVIGLERSINPLTRLPQFDTLAKRSGFNLAFSTPLTSLSDDSYKQILIMSNLLVTAGMDILFKNSPQTGDDLSQLFKKAILTSDDFLGEFKNSTAFSKIDDQFLQSRLMVLFIGLMMFVLENESHHRSKIPTPKELFAQTFTLLQKLFASHLLEKQHNKASGQFINICLVADAVAPDTFLCLRIQAMWYSTRKFPFTLLALKDRNNEFKNKLPPFSPFVTYMRFHADELIFLGILIRVLKSFKALKKFWNLKSNLKKIPKEVKFPDIKPNDQKIILQAFKQIILIKDDSIKNPLKTWVSLGLIQYYADNKLLPKWFALSDLKTKSPDFKDRNKGASAALRTLTIIKKYNLTDTLNFVLEFTPIKTFFDANVFENANDPAKRLFMSKVFTKAHSFERVRLVYQEADQNPVSAGEQAVEEFAK
jgi:hypothetical protein